MLVAKSAMNFYDHLQTCRARLDNISYDRRSRPGSFRHVQPFADILVLRNVYCSSLYTAQLISCSVDLFHNMRKSDHCLHELLSYYSQRSDSLRALGRVFSVCSSNLHKQSFIVGCFFGFYMVSYLPVLSFQFLRAFVTYY